MKIKKTLTVNAPPDAVWDILGPNYVRAGDWASSVYVSGARPGTPKIAGAPAAGRTCETSLGPFTETIEAYDEARRHVAYSATGDKMPSFMKGLRNAWTVRPKGGVSEVEMELNADIAFPFNILMAPMMKMQFGKVLREATEELKHYAETGKPHPRKLKADSSKKAVAARAATA
ncbi:SRPBCC family protein [uncultured Roseobacter sp.]|uniref:SRPBCC family protein n=1 Tax=uncultured Roseobacter sp. TaxID=114847 RepID=UPI00260BDB47|nr:SRPBCC family protein [uncultured Roseobacter sp.]